MKPCSKCKKLLAPESFSKSRKSKSGLSSRCKGCSSLIRKEWGKINMAVILENNKRWALNNPEKVKAIKRKYREKNAKFLDGLCKKWRKENPGISKAMAFNSSSLRRGAVKQSISSRKLSELFNNAKGRCSYCGSENKKLTFDHMTAISKGGKHALDNIAIACLTCNSRKRDLNLNEFREYCLEIGIKLII